MVQMARLVVDAEGDHRSRLAMTGEELATRLLYRDGLMLVIDKPAGIAVHRGPKGGENLEDFFCAALWLAAQSPSRAQARSRYLGLPSARAAPQGARKARPPVQTRQDRKDLLGDRGRQPCARRRHDRPAARASRSRSRLVDEGRSFGPPIATSWRVLGRSAGGAFLELAPLTGRTHQLRVHCAALGWPILGDAIYGHGGAMGLQLHARAITVPLYKNKDAVKVEAPLPGHMREALAAFG